MPGFRERAVAAFNVLSGNEVVLPNDMVVSSEKVSAYRSAWRDNAAAVMAPIVTRLAMDVASLPIRHVRVDKWGRYLETIPSELNDRLTIGANIDQTGRAFIQDATTTMLVSGSVALVPINVSYDPNITTSYDIYDVRAAEITQWFNRSIRVSVYDVEKGFRVERTVPKVYAAIAYNPLYLVMNEPNSTLRRLIDKLALLDVFDERSATMKLDLIIQLPFAIKGSTRQREAKRRIEMITEQLMGSRYGIAYIDAAEKIHQLNRPVTNNLIEEIKYLASTLYNQLGLTEEVFNGTADEQTLIAYTNRSVEPLVHALLDPMIRSFLTTTARRQGQSIMAFPNLFKMAPLSVLSEAADKFTRNEILTSNQIRQFLGIEPSDDPKASELRNKNIAAPVEPEKPSDPQPKEEGINEKNETEE